MKMIQTTSLLGALALSAGSANAVLIAYEGFDYTADTLLTSANNGGSGFANGWESVATGTGKPVPTIRSGELTSPVGGLPSTGGYLEVVGSSDRHHRSLTSELGTDNTTIYISFLARQLGSVRNAAFELNRNNGNAQNILTFGSDSGGVFGLSDKTGSNKDIPVIGTTGFLPPDQDVHQWLIQIDYNAGSNDDVSFFYDGVLQGKQTGLGNLRFDEVGGLFFSGTAGMEVDEIRIGTELADVIPEPSSALLLGLGALGFLRRRR